MVAEIRAMIKKNAGDLLGVPGEESLFGDVEGRPGVVGVWGGGRSR